MNTSTLSPINRKNWLTPNRACNIIWVIIILTGFFIGAVAKSIGIEHFWIELCSLISAIIVVKIARPIKWQQEKEKFFDPDGKELATSRSAGNFFLGIAIIVALWALADHVFVSKAYSPMFNALTSALFFSSFFTMPAIFYSLKDEPISLLFAVGTHKSKPLTPEELEILQHNQRHRKSSHTHTRDWRHDPVYRHRSGNVFNRMNR